MNLDLGNRLPSFAIVEEASHHDSVRAEATTANLKCGDILVADRAYTDFKFLCSLAMRGVFYVVRWKRNIKLEVVSARPVERPEAGKSSEAKVRVLKDEIVKPAMPGTAKSYSCDGGVLRCVTAEVEYYGKMLEMSFLTNNMEWSARTIAELYRARWGIETFFKELKQTCQIRVRVAAAQRCGTARILRREWDSTWWNPRGAGLQTPVFAGFPAVRRRTNGTARVEKPAFSGLSGIAMKNGGAYRSSAYPRTQVATRIFEHYELTPMRSGMIV